MFKKFIQCTSSILLLVAVYSCHNSANKIRKKVIAPLPVTAITMSGRTIFNNNCAICHGLKTEKSGPKLEGVLTRWDNNTPKMKKFITSSSQMIAGGDSYSVTIFNKYNKAVMPDFKSLNEAQLDSLVSYINNNVE